jgi:hypothetical protein
VSTKVFAGLDTSTDFREATYSFDGFGRLKTKHTPEQDAQSTSTYTYYPDNALETSTDGRGATRHMHYNSRGLTDEISWSVSRDSVIQDSHHSLSGPRCERLLIFPEYERHR